MLVYKIHSIYLRLVLSINKLEFQRLYPEYLIVKGTCVSLLFIFYLKVRRYLDTKYSLC